MTKLLTIVLLLLLSCGVVEAQQDLYTDCIHKAPDGTVYDICRMPDMRKILDVQPTPKAHEPNPKLWYVDPQLGVMFISPCELKMKEAMKLVEKYKGDLWSPFHITAYSYSGYYPSTERCVTSACLQKELDEAKAKEKKEEEREEEREKALAKWRTVYKECVQ